MSSLAAIFRLLYSSEASFESKVEAAESLVKALLDGADSRGASAEAELPLLVRAHYLRSLLEWSCGAVTKKGGEAAGTDGNKGKKRKQQAGAATDEAARPPSLQPRCWAVLAAVLGSPATPASQPLPAALLPAATAALQALQRGGLAAAPAAAEAVALLDQLAALLRLLGSKFAGSFRPSTEHAAAAAEAALSGHAAATARRSARGGAASTAAQDWEAVAAAAVRLLLAAAVGHPNQRKVWDAAVPRLLPLLAGAGFPPGGPSEGSTPLLQAFCRQALEAVLFNPQHVQPLAAAAAAEMAAAVAEAEVAAGGEAAAVAPAAEGSAGAQHKGGAAAGYTAQLFTTLQRQVGERQLPLGLLPWMAGRFCTALRQHRRAAETEAAITGQSGRRSQQTAGGNEDTAGDGGSGAGSAPARPAGTGSGLSVSADFHFWLALLRTLSPRVSQLQQEGGHAGGSADLADAVSGVAGLAAALREHQLYRPTQDPAGQQHLLLQQLADAALQLAQQHGRSGHGNSSGSDSAAAAAAAAGVLPAALGVLQGILAVEHRVIQQQLPLLWPLLLWSPEAAGRGGNGGVAAVVACSLVAAFAELRQLEVLLQSLTAALLQEPMRQQAGGEADTAGSAAAAVLRSSTFRAALAAAVRQLPSGQVPMVLRLAAEGVGQLTGTTTSSSSSSSSSGSTGGSSTGQLLVLELHSACLASLTIDLTTAAAAAMAAQALVAALGPALLPLLAAAAAGGASGASSSKKERKTGRKQEQARGEQALAPALLPALLRLHRQALAVHGRCAALHPEVSPLPGRHLQPPAHEAEASPALASYFAPLLAGQQQASTAPQLSDLLSSPGSSSSSSASGDSELRQALLHAAQQQLLLRHQQVQYLVHTCPVTVLPPPGADVEQEEEQGAGEAERHARQEQQQRRWAEERQQAESELRQLADFIAAAAAEEAADSTAGEPAALQLAAQALPALQAWAAPPLLQSLLQASLRRAAAAAASSADTLQQLCRQLLLGGELLEQHRLAALLPAAAAAEQVAALSAVLEEGCAGGAPAANGEQEGSAKKKRKKERQSDAGAAASSGGHMAALLAQLGRLAKGKAVKGSAWAAAVQGASAELATLTESSSSSGGSSSSGKKRKQQEIGGEAAIATTADALHAVQRQAELLGQLPLSYLPSEAAAGMAALAVGSLLCCCRASLTRQSQPALLAALPAASACMSVLARLAGARASADGGLASQLQLLPQVLKAALAAMGCAAACCDSGTSDAAAQQVAAAADHSSTAMQAVCAEYLAAADGGSLQQLAEELSRPLAQEQQEGRWAAAVLAQACLSACCTAAGATGSASGNKAAAEIACGGSSQQACSPAVAPAVGAAATRIEAAVAAALPPAAAAALDGWRQATLTGVLYGCSAQLLRLHCCDSPAADELGRQQQQQAGGSGCVSGMAGALQAAAGLLDRLLPPAEQHGREQGGVQGSSAAALLVCPLLEYVAACCAATGRMRPAASSTHYASLLALLLHLLARQPACGSGPIPPSRHTLPFAAAFPAATAVTAHQAPVAGSSNAAGVRPLLLEALRDLVAGSSSQQLLLPLRFAEAALPAAPAGSGAALAHCELLLALVEEAGGNRQQRLLGQHSEHIAVLLTAFVSTTAYASPAQWQQSEQQQHREQQTFASLRQLAAAILAAAGAEGGSASANPAAAAALAAAPTPPGQQPCSAAAAAPTQAEVAALCTALRVLESLSARPKLFPLPAAATCSILSSVAAVWTAYAEGQQQAARLGSSAAAAPLPGFRYRLDASSGAGLFAGSCHLLMALLRHRQQDLRRCLPLLLQALRALLRFLAAAELSARLQLRVLAPAGVPAACSVQQWQQEQRWRLKCAELLAGVLAELAGLKDVGVGRYCPQLLADYLLLAAAPPSGRSKALLHFSSPAATLAARRASHSDSGGSHGSDAAAAAGAAAAAAAEMDALAGEPLSPAVAAALRRGAFALYGACSASEIQFLYASLGSGGAGAAASWRGALAALKADFEKHYKYTGKV